VDGACSAGNCLSTPTSRTNPTAVGTVATRHPQSDRQIGDQPTRRARRGRRGQAPPRAHAMPKAAAHRNRQDQGICTDRHALAACLSRMRGQLARPVLRGPRRGNASGLPDQGTGTRPKVVVIGGARGVVGHAGTRLLADLADKTGLTRGSSRPTHQTSEGPATRWRPRRSCSAARRRLDARGVPGRGAALQNAITMRKRR
jgi:hypothetical protein